MRKGLLILIIAAMAVQVQAQNINAKRITVADSIWLNGKWVKGVSDDSTMGVGADNVIPTQGAVKSALNNLTNYVNVLNFGAKADSSTPASDAINSAIDYQAARGGGVVYIPPGKYLIDKSIRLKNGTTLLATGAHIYLANNANTYMVRNDSFSGNNNIAVIGGVWNGNAHNNTELRVNDTTTLETDWYGFGFVFCNVNGLRVSDLELDSSQTWGIAHFAGDNEIFENLIFHQQYRRSYNGDGINGNSKHVVINNIRGYTNDDLVNVNLASPGAMGNHGVDNGYWPFTDTTYSAVVKNITAEKYNNSVGKSDSASALKAIRVLVTNGGTLKNLVIDNINGYTTTSPITINTYYNVGDRHQIPGHIDQISISNVNVKINSDYFAIPSVAARGYFDFTNLLNTGNIYINNVSKGNIDAPLLGTNNSGINNLFISNVQTSSAILPFIYDNDSKVKNVYLSNIAQADSGSVLHSALYYKHRISGDNDSVRIFVQNINYKSDAEPLTLGTSQTRISLNGTSVPVDTSKLTPAKGDIVSQKNYGPVYYNGSYWVPLVIDNAGHFVYNGSLSSGDMNNLKTMGSYTITSAATISNRPPDFTTGSALLEVDPTSGNYILQRLYNVNDATSKYYRLGNLGTWTSWVKQPAFTGSNLNITGNMTAAQFFVSDLNTAPSSATDTGTKGEIRITADAIYVCIDTNTWVKAALSSW